MEATRSFRSMFLTLFLSILFLSVTSSAYASHFRYGYYSWRPVGGTTIEVTLQNAFRRDGYECIDPTTLGSRACSPGDGDPQVGDVIEEVIGGTRFEWGDGTSVGSPNDGPLLYLVRAIDPASNSLFGFALDPDSLPALDTTLSHTYAVTGNPTAFTDSCCRISSSDGVNEHINNPDASYRVETVINVGTANDSPISALPPIVRCPIDALCSFQVPVTDPDNDPVRFRLSTSAEATGFGGFVQPGPPDAPTAATIDPTTGIYSWDTTGARRAGNPANNTLYSTQVTIEDPTSKAALDFFIQLAPPDPTPPVITPPPGSPPVCGRTELIAVGNTKSFDVLASDPDAGDTVTLNVAALPVGAIMTPSLPVTGNPLSSIFSWAPLPEQAGRHVVNFTASSAAGGFALCPVFVRVGIVPPGGEVQPGAGRNDCRRSGCTFSLKCNLPEDLGPCTNQIDVTVPRRAARLTADTAARAPSRIRFASGVANIPAGQTSPVRFTLTPRGKRIVRSGVKRIRGGRLEIRNLSRIGVTATPIRIIRLR